MDISDNFQLCANVRGVTVIVIWNAVDEPSSNDERNC